MHEWLWGKSPKAGLTCAALSLGVSGATVTADIAHGLAGAATLNGALAAVSIVLVVLAYRRLP